MNDLERNLKNKESRKRFKKKYYIYLANAPIGRMQIKKIIKDADWGLNEGTEDFKIAEILLCSAYVGADIQKISWITKIPLKDIIPYETRLRDNQVWIGKEVHCEWMNEETGGIAFLMDLMVAKGYLMKSGEKANKKRGA